MKINLKLANGATLEFEGDESEFQRVSEFLAEPPESLVADSGTGSAQPQEEAPEHPDVIRGINPAAVAARFEQVGVRNDQERLTVIAQMAVESGREGADYATVTDLYTELGLPEPAQFPSKTFSNAKTSGLVRSVKPGIWRPTHIGGNFARGLGRGPERPTRRTGSRTRASSSDGGGEPD